MLRSAMLLTLCLLLAGGLLPARGEEEMLPVFGGEAQDALAPESLEAERSQAWDAYSQAQIADETLIRETAAHAMQFGEATMRYFIRVIGEKPENGYPMYIAMHGGGSDDTPDFNDSQWEMMQSYYSDALECGVYIATRGVRDTWDTHFNPESYPLYDRLIQYMILTQEVDPNRVYLEGFSAGGDGVYAIAPRMADRFAAANMSSGHPNGISMVNMKHLPIQLQAGEYDAAYDRNTVTAEYGIILDKLEKENGGYAHRTLIHYNCGHNYNDYGTQKLPVMADPQAWLENNDRSIDRINSFPPDYMDQFTRDPLPHDMVWDLNTRAGEREVESFYYLSAPMSTNQGAVWADYDRESNEITLRAEGLNGDFSVLLNEKMVDFAKPVTFTVNGKTARVWITPTRSVLEQTTQERGDPNYQFEAVIPYAALLEWTEAN